MTVCPNGGKKIFESENAAKRARNLIAKRSNHKQLKVYLCPACHGWHLTNHRATWK